MQIFNNCKCYNVVINDEIFSPYPSKVKSRSKTDSNLDPPEMPKTPSKLAMPASCLYVYTRRGYTRRRVTVKEAQRQSNAARYCCCCCRSPSRRHRCHRRRHRQLPEIRGSRGTRQDAVSPGVLRGFVAVRKGIRYCGRKRGARGSSGGLTYTLHPW